MTLPDFLLIALPSAGAGLWFGLVAGWAQASRGRR